MSYQIDNIDYYSKYLKYKKKYLDLKSEIEGGSFNIFSKKKKKEVDFELEFNGDRWDWFGEPDYWHNDHFKGKIVFLKWKNSDGPDNNKLTICFIDPYNGCMKNTKEGLLGRMIVKGISQPLDDKTVVAVEAMISEIRSFFFVVKPDDSKKIQDILKVNDQIK